MCESFNICVRVTAAESPFSNGLVERHNAVLGNILDKILEDAQCDVKIALAWAVNAKNSLTNIHGFSAYQLAIGYNPILPTNFNSNPPALTSDHTNNIISENLKCMNSARKHFLESESSERIRRALASKIRTSKENRYKVGDMVYFRRPRDTKWRGPGTVVGVYNDNGQFLIKFQSQHHRVHHCHMNPVKQTNKHPDNELITETSTVINRHNDIEPPAKTQTYDRENSETTTNISIEKPKTSTYSRPEIVEQELKQTGNADSNTLANLTTENNLADLKSQLKDCVVTIEPIHQNERDHTYRQKNMKPLQNLKKNDFITYKKKEDVDWQTVQLKSRAGKSSGVWKNSWNVEAENGKRGYVVFDGADIEIRNDDNNDTNDTETSNETNETHFMFNNTFSSEIDTSQIEAKDKELRNWSEQKVYEEVDDNGQSCISVRWVISPKVIDGIIQTKARLCAKGFEEDSYLRTDSPTSSKVGLRVTLFIIAAKRWVINSIDVKAAFLQGSPIDREIFLRPPKEANTNKIWHLLKCVYGLNDASRHWYLRLREELIKLGGTPCRLDQGIFMFFSNDNLIGIIIIFVDDLIHAGTTYFTTTIITQLKTTFLFGSEQQGIFKYIGINLTQINYEIFINQNQYSKNICEIEITADRQRNHKFDKLTNNELKQFRSIIGQLNWLSGISRPDISFQTCYASGIGKNASVKDINYINKVVKQVKNNLYSIKIPSLDLTCLKLVTYTDASFKNLPNGGSQGGYTVFLCDENSSIPISWRSRRLKRIVRSTLAAETLALCEGCDASFFVSNMLTEVLGIKNKIESHVLTDNKSLFNAANTSNEIDDLKLKVELSEIRQQVDNKDIILHWIETKDNLADCLTKIGASSQLLIDTISHAKTIIL